MKLREKSNKLNKLTLFVRWLATRSNSYIIVVAKTNNHHITREATKYNKKNQNRMFSFELESNRGPSLANYFYFYMKNNKLSYWVFLFLFLFSFLFFYYFIFETIY